MSAVCSFCLEARHCWLCQHRLKRPRHRLQPRRPGLGHQLKLLEAAVTETLEKQAELAGQMLPEPRLRLVGACF